MIANAIEKFNSALHRRNKKYSIEYAKELLRWSLEEIKSRDDKINGLIKAHANAVEWIYQLKLGDKMSQLGMFRPSHIENTVEAKPLFDGVTYDADKDRERLSGQLLAVKKFMSDGAWHTLEEIERATGANQASSSARLRDLRKAKFGGYRVERRRAAHVESGLFQYRVSR